MQGVSFTLLHSHKTGAIISAIMAGRGYVQPSGLEGGTRAIGLQYSGVRLGTKDAALTEKTKPEGTSTYGIELGLEMSPVSGKATHFTELNLIALVKPLDPLTTGPDKGLPRFWVTVLRGKQINDPTLDRGLIVDGLEGNQGEVFESLKVGSVVQRSDSMFTDIEAALNADLKSLGINPEGNSSDAEGRPSGRERR